MFRLGSEAPILTWMWFLPRAEFLFRWVVGTISSLGGGAPNGAELPYLHKGTCSLFELARLCVFIEFRKRRK